MIRSQIWVRRVMVIELPFAQYYNLALEILTMEQTEFARLSVYKQVLEPDFHLHCIAFHSGLSRTKKMQRFFKRLEHTSDIFY